jgi:hypothetical protein
VPSRRTDKTVVDRISRFPLMSAILDYSSAMPWHREGVEIGGALVRLQFREFLGNESADYRCDLTQPATRS